VNRLVAIVTLVGAASIARADDTGFTASAGGGLDVGAPFGELQLGRRFTGAPHFELFVDYSYNAAISTYRFHTFGVGARTYITRFGQFELFHQALAAFALGSGGHLRTFGDRLLGAFVTQGIGMSAHVSSCWSAAVVVSTGYPVWLRPELVVRYRF